MKECRVYGISLPDAYHNALLDLDLWGEELPCPDYNTKQKEVSMTMVVAEPLAEPMISKFMIAGPKELEQYRQEMLDGILDFEIERGKWPYTYHDRIAWQIPFVVQELKRNPHSRRAAIDVRSPRDMISDDPACLQHLQFFVRDGKLHLKVLFRSNDACKATFMNAFALIMLQQRIGDQLGLEVGTYTHRANSFHVYEADYAALKSNVERFVRGDQCTYYYSGDWCEMMKEAQEEIAETVARLKGE